jgi:hypothetical protein
MSDDVMSVPAVPRVGPDDEQLPDAALFWRWAAAAVRPWAGWILAGVGIVVIIVGWYGVSGEALVAKQLPYLISGGLGGVALVGIGAAMISAERRRQDTGRIERLEEMVGELRAVLLSHPDAPTDRVGAAVSLDGAGASHRAGPSTNGAAPAPAGVVALPTGTTYHSPGCQMVRGKDGVEAVTARGIEQRGLSACRVCEPALTTG